MTREETIQKIETELKNIDTQIAALENSRQAIYELDEEYALYRDNYLVYYNDEPLGIRQYYENMDKLIHLNGLLTAAVDSGDFDELFNEFMPEIAKLERELGV